MPKMRKRLMAVLSPAIVCLMLLVTNGVAGAQTPEYGGILKIIDMAEGAKPIGVPWENFTIDTKLMTPVIETLLDEDLRGKDLPPSRHRLQGRPERQDHYLLPQKGRQVP